MCKLWNKKSEFDVKVGKTVTVKNVTVSVFNSSVCFNSCLETEVKVCSTEHRVVYVAK